MSESGVDSGLWELSRDPGQTALLLDVDGTLAPIITNPLDASVPLEVRRTLIGLGRAFGLVACVSGRTASEARRIVGAGGLVYVGCHGSEFLHPGSDGPVTDTALEPWKDLVGATASRSMSSLAPMGVRLEEKGAICALHWRDTPDEEASRAALEQVAKEAQEGGLAIHWGRKVLELRPPVPFSKGLAVEKLLDGSGPKRAMYAGDDTTDVDAFGALRRMTSDGRLDSALCVGVLSAEVPNELRQTADLLVDGPQGVATLLEELLELTSR